MVLLLKLSIKNRNNLVQQREPDFEDYMDDYNEENEEYTDDYSPHSESYIPPYMENEEYDENNDENLHQKLVTSKIARKKVEEDVKLLSNRIFLLRMEEQKALKKIDETKKRAKEIVELRERNTEIQKKKNEKIKQKEDEERNKLIQNKIMKEQIKENILNSKNAQHIKRKSEASKIKTEKNEQKNLINLHKEQEFIKNLTIKQEEKQVMAKINMTNKIHNENKDEVSRLEEEELELIKKLQNTQLNQEAAFAELETALSYSGGFSPVERTYSKPISRSSNSHKNFKLEKNTL